MTLCDQDFAFIFQLALSTTAHYTELIKNLNLHQQVILIEALATAIRENNKLIDTDIDDVRTVIHNIAGKSDISEDGFVIMMLIFEDSIKSVLIESFPLL